jgi:hypothetical protein
MERRLSVPGDGYRSPTEDMPQLLATIFLAAFASSVSAGDGWTLYVHHSYDHLESKAADASVRFGSEARRIEEMVVREDANSALLSKEVARLVKQLDRFAADPKNRVVHPQMFDELEIRFEIGGVVTERKYRCGESSLLIAFTMYTSKSKTPVLYSLFESLPEHQLKEFRHSLALDLPGGYGIHVLMEDGEVQFIPEETNGGEQ